jgi:(p)ppGpp synthase/HD superfamily hydrolase
MKRVTPSLVERARAYAVAAHGTQLRKWTGEPYWHHLRDVAERVALLTDDEEVIAAAWLHDVLEDTPKTYNEVSEAFGQRVADLVLDLTDLYTPELCPHSNRAKRKALEATRLGLCFPEVRLVKLCDVQSNAGSIEEHGGDFAEVWKTEKKELVKQLLRRN